jgi:hypothetical protein
MTQSGNGSNAIEHHCVRAVASGSIILKVCLAQQPSLAQKNKRRENEFHVCVSCLPGNS